MEFSLVDLNGLPNDCLLSIRAGSSRRQATVNSEAIGNFHLKFPKSVRKGESIKLDFYQHLGEAKVSHPESEGASNEYTLDVDLKGGSTGKVIFKVVNGANGLEKLQALEESRTLEVAHVPSTDKDQTTTLSTSHRHQDALEARKYFDKHNLVAWTQVLFQDLMRERPADPWTYINERTDYAKRKKVEEEEHLNGNNEAVEKLAHEIEGLPSKVSMGISEILKKELEDKLGPIRSQHKELHSVSQQVLTDVSQKVATLTAKVGVPQGSESATVYRLREGLASLDTEANMMKRRIEELQAQIPITEELPANPTSPSKVPDHSPTRFQLLPPGNVQTEHNRIAQVVKKFESFDTNGDGELDKHELACGLRAMNRKVWTNEAVDKLWQTLDKNNDGKISYDEFLAFLIPRVRGREKGFVMKSKRPASSEASSSASSVAPADKSPRMFPERPEVQLGSRPPSSRSVSVPALHDQSTLNFTGRTVLPQNLGLSMQGEIGAPPHNASYQAPAPHPAAQHGSHLAYGQQHWYPAVSQDPYSDPFVLSGQRRLNQTAHVVQHYWAPGPHGANQHGDSEAFQGARQPNDPRSFGAHDSRLQQYHQPNAPQPNYASPRQGHPHQSAALQHSPSAPAPKWLHPSAQAQVRSNSPMQRSPPVQQISSPGREMAQTAPIATHEDRKRIAQVVHKFRTFDVNGDGVIEKHELAKVLKAMNPRLWTDMKIDHLWQTLDVNQDGSIEYGEFEAYVIPRVTGQGSRPSSHRGQKTGASRPNSARESGGAPQ